MGTFRLGVVTALWRRPRITRTVLAHYAQLDVPGVRLVGVAARSPEDPERASDVPGWEYTEAANSPLSDKWNTAARALKGRVDAVMIVGSDDLVAGAYILRAVGVLRGSMLVRCSGCYFVNTETGEAIKAAPRRQGAGRILSAALLDALDWCPWESGLDRRLDASMDRRVGTARRVKQKVVEGLVVDLKSGVNMWDWDEVQRMRIGETTSGRRLLEEHFPQALDLLPPDTTTMAVTRKAENSARATATKSRSTDRRTFANSAPVEKEEAERHKAEVEAAEKALGKGSVKLTALKNIPPHVNRGMRVYAGGTYTAPPEVAQRHISAKLSEKA